MADRRAWRPEPGIFSILPVGFVDHPLFAQALTHRSGTDGSHDSNERLELLGDAVLELVITDQLYHRFPDATEGRLTKLRAALVSRATLAERAEELGLGELLVVGQADAKSANALSNALEAIVGAVYETDGLLGARHFVAALLDPLLAAAGDDEILGDYKSHLHELLAQLRQRGPHYEVDWTGPDHDRVFRVRLSIEGLGSFEGVGHSRKEAEQVACREALDEIGVSGFADSTSSRDPEEHHSNKSRRQARVKKASPPGA
ncbi:ribonuclease III [Ferrimicrobium sp.]|uniref:ribonuclease III n=1 Tax=Ferrimicrobium sp. TaxID=2926050 RepID=UPI00261D10C9|nr:ribonuclease III [Ferrimicrobium sp.]